MCHTRKSDILFAMYHVRIDSTFMLLCWFNGLKPSGPGVYVCGIMNVWGLKYSVILFVCFARTLSGMVSRSQPHHQPQREEQPNWWCHFDQHCLCCWWSASDSARYHPVTRAHLHAISTLFVLIQPFSWKIISEGFTTYLVIGMLVRRALGLQIERKYGLLFELLVLMGK